MKVKASDLRYVIEKIQAEKNLRGTFFSIETITRGTGRLRKFVSHFGYKKYLKDGTAPYDFEEKNLLPVWDRTAWKKLDKTGKGTAIRTINCNDIHSLKCCKQTLILEGFPTQTYTLHLPS